VLTGSSFGTGVAGPYDPTRRSGCGHFLMVVDIATALPAREFTARMEALVTQTKANSTAPGVEEIFVPGEIELRNAERHAAGIALPTKTWQDLSALAAEAGVAMPAHSSAGTES
jgi:LDH2 family malate/lactate/ureidoglycolate dehydrogenase